MLIEQFAYLNRWRRVAPEAKVFFMLAGFCAAFAAGQALISALVAVLYALLTIFGAGVPLGVYLRVAVPALFFLGAALFSLILRLVPDQPFLSWSEAGLFEAGQVGGRSLAGLSVLLFLAFTTPFNDLLALLRRWRVPETLLDIMAISYRAIFVFFESVREMHVAQAARLGQADLRKAMRSAALLFANITAQVWQRSLALHQAALARNNDGPLRFLAAEFPYAGQESALALAAGLLLNALVFVAR